MTVDQNISYTATGGESSGALSLTTAWPDTTYRVLASVVSEWGAIGVDIPLSQRQTGQFTWFTTAPLNQAYSFSISNATNATPITITTTAANPFVTGLTVTISGVGGNTAANGTWTITVTSSTTFTLNGSTGNGAYTSGGTVTTNADRIDFHVYDANITGQLLGSQVLTTTGTYTPTSGTKSVWMRMVGGGGGGGGAQGGTGTAAAGGGGSSGTYLEIMISSSTAITGGSVTIGTGGGGGTGSTHSTGGTGNDTTIMVNGSTYTARGGFGGNGGAASTGPNGAAGGNSQSGSSAGDVVFAVGGGFGIVVSSAVSFSGLGGTCPLGSFPPFQSAQGFGCGGNGGQTNSTLSRNGGGGGAGVVIVKEYG